MLSFGQGIPVTGPLNGFPGTVSRVGERVITARQFVPYNTAKTLSFGEAAYLIPNQVGGYWTSVADLIANGSANIAKLTAASVGIAVREVKTQLTYPQTPGVSLAGYYGNGQMAEVLQRGTATVTLAVGSPNAGDQVYVRMVVNPNVTAGLVGDWETNPAATDSFTQQAGIVQGSPTATLSAANANILVGMPISGNGVLPGTFVQAVAGTAVTMNQNAQATVAAGLLTFSNLFAVPGCVARTGNLDANGILEITLERRYQA